MNAAPLRDFEEGNNLEVYVYVFVTLLNNIIVNLDYSACGKHFAWAIYSATSLFSIFYEECNVHSGRCLE